MPHSFLKTRIQVFLTQTNLCSTPAHSESPTKSPHPQTGQRQHPDSTRAECENTGRGRDSRGLTTTWPSDSSLSLLDIYCAEIPAKFLLDYGQCCILITYPVPGAVKGMSPQKMPGSVHALKSNLLSEIKLRFSCNWWCHESQKGELRKLPASSWAEPWTDACLTLKKENVCWYRLDVTTPGCPSIRRQKLFPKTLGKQPKVSSWQ